MPIIVCNLPGWEDDFVEVHRTTAIGWERDFVLEDGLAIMIYPATHWRNVNELVIDEQE